MTSLVKPDRKRTEFVTEVSMINFARIFPGQAVESEKKAGSRYYKCEIYMPAINQQMYDAFCYVASLYESSNWQAHANAQFKTLEQMCQFVPGYPPPKRKYELYPYAKGQYVMNFSKAVSLKMLKMEGADLTNPVIRADFDRKVNEAAPKVSRYANLNDPADIAKLDQMSQNQMLRGGAAIPREAYGSIMLPVSSSELWNGCKVRVQGRVYWDSVVHKTCLPALEQIMLVSQGERITSAYDVAPEEAFGQFAPAADLAPQPLQQPGLIIDPYAGLF